MTPQEFYEQMASVKEKEYFTLLPGPITLIATPVDALAARLIIWLVKEMPEGATQGDFEEVLTMALWWSQFWNMVHEAEKQREIDKHAEQQEAMPL